MSGPEEPLDRLLRRWRDVPDDDPGLRREVWSRIARDGRRGFPPAWLAWLGQPAFLFALACVLGGLLVAEWRSARLQRELNTRLAAQYLSLIDPRATAVSGRPSLERELSWMRDDLRLSPAQYERLRALHEQSGPRLQALAREAEQVRSESEAMERRRQEDDQVDFLAVARMLEARATVDRQSTDLTRRVVAAAATLMTPEQRSRYLKYVQAALSPPPADGPGQPGS